MYNKIINGISSLDKEVMKKSSKRIDSLIKPIGSLGKLEDIAIQLAGITGKVKSRVDKKCVIVMAADNGVVEEGVSSAPQEITAAQSINTIKGLSGISVLCKQVNADVKVVDVGICRDIYCEGLITEKIKMGTSNISKGPAMTKEEAINAIEVGMKLVEKLYDEGYKLLGTGELGIGNTTTSSAIIMSFTDIDADKAVGRGAGMNDVAFKNKKDIVNKSIKINKPNKNDPLDVLSKIGGLDIAGLVGCFLAAAYYRIPIVIDGVISAAAALISYKLNPITKEYMIPSHCSAEYAYKLIMKEIGLEPNLYLNMRLGEGTGCPLMFPIIESAAAIMADMATFDEVAMDNDFLVDIR